MRTHLSLQRRQRAGRSHPWRRLRDAPPPCAPSVTGAARSVRLSRSPARCWRWRRRSPAQYHCSRVRCTGTAAALRRPPSIPRAGPQGRARNLGEAGSAELAKRASTGRWGQRYEGSNPSLSADIPESFSLLQTAVLRALPTGCPKLSRSIASQSALGARCMYRRVMLSVECPTSS